MVEMFNLPNDVLVNVLTEWTSLRDIAVVDSSMCNIFFRSVLSNLFSSTPFVHISKDMKDNKEFYRWLAIRQIKIHNYKLTKYEKTKLNELHELLSGVRKFQYLEINYCQNLLVIFQRYCNIINHLCLGNRDDLDDDAFLSLLQQIKGLTKIDISSCPKVTETSIAELAKLFPNLESYVGAYFSPSIVKNCKKLKEVVIEQPIDNEMMALLTEHCPQIEVIHVMHLAIDLDELTISTFVKRCNRIKSWILSSATIGDNVVLTLVQNCKQLTALDISYTEITDNALIAIGKHSSLLKDFSCNNCDNVSDVGISAIAENCPQITALTLDDCVGITDISLHSIAKHLPKLIILSANGCSFITDASVLAVLATNTDLVDLDVANCKVTDETLEFMTRNCESLTLSKLSVINARYLVTRMMKHGMRYVALDNRIPIAISTFNQMIKSSPQLQYISITEYSDLTNAAVKLLVQQCNLLNSIRIIDCEKITAVAVKNIVKYCKNLHTLVLNNMQTLPDDIIVELVTTRPYIRVLKISDAKLLTDVSVLKIAECCKNSLRELCLSNSSNKITSKAFRNILINCKFLYSLDVERCDWVNETLLSDIVSSCENLRKINLTGCKNVSKKAFVEFLMNSVGYDEILCDGNEKVED